MQEAPNAEGIHGFIHNNGESPRSIATLHPLLLLLLAAGWCSVVSIFFFNVAYLVIWLVLSLLVC